MVGVSGASCTAIDPCKRKGFSCPVCAPANPVIQAMYVSRGPAVFSAASGAPSQNFYLSTPYHTMFLCKARAADLASTDGILVGFSMCVCTDDARFSGSSSL